MKKMEPVWTGLYYVAAFDDGDKIHTHTHTRAHALSLSILIFISRDNLS